MFPRILAALCLMLSLASAQDANVFRMKPGVSLSALRNRLRDEPGIREVVFEAGTYRGGLAIKASKGQGAPEHLLLRAEDGAEVVFDGSAPVKGAQPVEGREGVFSIPYRRARGEYPKLWEPGTRTRYTLAADVASVERFPATFAPAEDKLYFHTSDGQPPGDDTVLRSANDYGLFIARPNVTVRGISFRNYRVREKWSTAVDLRVKGNITVENCRALNCSLGFIVNGADNAVLNCRVDDCGGGVYVGGENARVEGCRLFKKRDDFMVPMYAQDDTGIQFYYPAKGGVIRGNLCVGFGMGIFIKAKGAPYRVEHNTIDGAGQGLGFGATRWTEGERFAYNIVYRCRRQIQTPPKTPAADLPKNCFFPIQGEKIKAVGAGSIVADPRFVWPEYEDYRLANDSPCLELADDAGPAGAFPAIGDAKLDLGPPREWHVSSDGRDGFAGTEDKPVQTVQFAVDRAKPGDSVILHPGFYPEPIRLTRGGQEGKPIVIRASEKWRAILDSNRKASNTIAAVDAAWIEIRDLEIRWYGRTAIHVTRSPNFTVAGCRIWNAHWYGTWPTGSAMRVHFSPGFTADHNVCFRQEHAVWLYNSPRSRVTHNTCVGNLYSGAAFLYSAKGSVCINNSLTFQGNDVLLIHENLGHKDNLKEFVCDYNNYGTCLRPQPEGTVFDSLKLRPEQSFLNYGSKAIFNYTEYRGKMNRIASMKAWREFSGLDAHSIFADPQYVDVAERDFRLKPGSPNMGAGKDGADLGAQGRTH